MKQANRRSLLLFILPFIGLLLLDVIVSQFDLSFRYDVHTTEPIQYIIMGGLTLLFVTPSLVFTAVRVHDVYIKRKKDIPLKYYYWFLFLTSLLTAYSFVLFNLKYYYTILVVIFLVILYFTTLFLADRAYVRQSQKSKMDVNDELIMQLLRYFGGNDNVESVSFEHSRLKVELKDPKIVNLEAIQELGATGIFVAGNRLQAFVGNDAERLQQAIKHYLSRSIYLYYIYK